MPVRITVITLAWVLIGMGFASDANAQRGWAPRLDGETKSHEGGISFPLWLAVGPDYGTYSSTDYQSYQGGWISEENEMTLYGLQVELTGRVAKFGSESVKPMGVDVKLALSGLFNSDIELLTAQMTPVARLFLKASRFEFSPYGGYGIGSAVKVSSLSKFVFVHGLRLGCDVMISESFGFGLSLQRTDMGKVLNQESVNHLSVEVIFGL